MPGHKAPRWHDCARWKLRGLSCPFEDWDFDEEDRDDDSLVPVPVGVPARKKVLRGMESAGVGVLAQAEEVVARYAERFPLPAPAGVPTGTLAEALRGNVPRGVLVGLGAAAAIWAVTKAYKGGGGGFNFESVFSPNRPFARP